MGVKNLQSCTSANSFEINVKSHSGTFDNNCLKIKCLKTIKNSTIIIVYAIKKGKITTDL